MAITHHPDISSLMTCAAGSQPEALCGVIASHLAICPACRREFNKMEIVGLALFENVPPADVVMGEPELAVAGSPADTVEEVLSVSALDSEVPHPLVSRLGTRLDDLNWQPLAPGIRHVEIPLRRAAKGDLRLIQLAPGAVLPEHGHRGEELTLVLRGSYSDGRNTFSVGDFADVDDDYRHKVIADARTGCILLVGSETEPEFLHQLARSA